MMNAVNAVLSITSCKYIKHVQQYVPQTYELSLEHVYLWVTLCTSIPDQHWKSIKLGFGDNPTRVTRTQRNATQRTGEH